ncbi:acyl carrier protein [Paenibacillus kobensis]|uniref:acyl carrier protein n=1 Tax=Paenibacillus kobensis TaxID=59841 RepID=UPI0013E3B0DA|nr:acyl carrier protein [Paenibacillus kobensis]
MNMDRLQIEELVIGCLKEVFKDGQHVDKSSKLLEMGMDSINFIRLVVDLEGVFNIDVPDEEVLLDNFKSVDSVSDIVERSLQS